MDVETLIWTLILFGGTVLAVVWLVSVAWRKDKDHINGGGQVPTRSEQQRAERDHLRPAIWPDGG